MKKRLVGVLLTLIMLLSLGAGMVQAAAPAVYQVGYAKADINPYVDENDHSKGLLPLPMAGNGFVNQRLSEPTKIDDTGDGKIDDRDGIFATCIAITDPSGETMLIISADFCGSTAALVTDLRAAIKEKYPEIDPTRIMFTASHTHSSIDLVVSGLSQKHQEYLALYNERLRVNLLRMVDEALADRSAATMYKGQIEANDSKASRKPVGDTINKYRPANDQVTVLPAAYYPDRVYNSVRHYAISIYPAEREVYKKGSGERISYYRYPKDEDGKYIPDLTMEPITYIRGANFNPDVTLGSTVSDVYYADEDGNKIATTQEEAWAWEARTGETAYWLADMGVATERTNVSEGDDTLLALEFRFADQSKKPIVLINWRAHTTLNRYVSDDYEELKEQGKYQDLGFYTSYYQISGDWVNAMRFVLEEEGYRPAFVQGAAGNMVAGGDASGPYGSWLDYATDTDRTHYRNHGNIYGTEMAEVALECLKEHMVQINKDGGDIRSMQIVYQTQKQKVEPGMFMAAHIYKSRYTPASPLGTKPYDVVYWLDANGEPLIDKNTGLSMVDDNTGKALAQTNAGGNPVVGVTRIAETQKIASIHHANSVISKYKSTSLTPGRLELNAFTIGTGFAMVTAPNELFDRYSRDADLETINYYNDWEKLWNTDTYGEPFMMGYANDSKGYIANNTAWDYSKGVLNWSGRDVYAEGSYETQTGWFARGTGEELIDVYKWMLDSLEERKEENNSVYCQHCKKETSWMPLSQCFNNTVGLTQGHYYVDQPVLQVSDIRVQNVHTVCLDLRGNLLTTEAGRVFTAGSWSALNVQDSVGGGKMAGTGYTTNVNGGTVLVEANATLNLYSGTLTNDIQEGRGVNNGGVVQVSGTFNIYGGQVVDGKSNWAGGNVYVNPGAQMNMYGGAVTGGTAEVGHTNCVVSRGGMLLAGDAVVSKLRLWPNGNNPPMSDILTVEGDFTGKAMLYIDGAKEGMDIGNLINGGNFGLENLYLSGNSLVPYIDGTDIVLGSPKVAAIYGKNGLEGYTKTLQDAINACQGTDKIISLQQKILDAGTVSKDVYMDLNGFDCVNMLTVKKGATVYLKDSTTDDFTGSYGCLEMVTGTVKAMSGYRLYTDENGDISAHAYSLDVTAAVLRPSAAGMFFTGTFKGDDQFKETVASYGIVLDVTKAPSFSTLNNTSKHTSYRDGFSSTNGVTSVLLKDILSEENSWRINARNGDITIHCRPFIRFNDSSYAWGKTRSISFRELVEKADALWTEEAVPQNLQELYIRFADAMESWDVPNLKNAVETSAPSPYRVYNPTTVAEINALPVATANMTSRELRQLCTDFFRMQNTFQWVSETDIRYSIRGKDTWLEEGQVYAGSPYSATSKSGNLYMTMEYYDQESGILKNPGMTDQAFIEHIGNHCTYGSFWGWARVINSMTTQWNIEMGLEQYGFIPLGDFSTAGISEWQEGVVDTGTVVDAAGKEAILEGYAKVKMADALYVWHGGNGNSHIRMAAQDAVVVRNADGSINADESYIVYLDQGSGWTDLEMDGVTIPVQGGVDKKVTFKKLYNADYLPFTFGEFIGTDPVEHSEIDSSLDGLTTVTAEQLAQTLVSSNYSISHVTVSVTDGKGEEVYRRSAFAPRILTMMMEIGDAVDTEALSALAGQHITVTCRLGTGEVYTLLDGTLKAS